MINADPELTLIQRVLRFANLQKVKSATEVESLFKDHPFARPAPFWEHVGKKDVKGLQDFRSLQTDLRSWLKTLCGGSSSELDELRRMVVDRFQEKSATELFVSRMGKDGKIYVKSEKLWGRVRFDLGETKKIIFSVEPFINGVESAVYYGIILLFQRGLWVRLRACLVKVKDGRQCDNWFVPSRELRAACSPEHKKLWNRQRVKSNVQRYYKESGRPIRQRKRARRSGMGKSAKKR